MFQCKNGITFDGLNNSLLKIIEGDTVLTLKQVTPVRLIKNKFYAEVAEAEARGATTEELKTILGRARAKHGMFEGNLDDGELEVGQVSASVKKIMPAADVVKEIWEEFMETRKGMCENF